jgi:NlpC/P60 family putative phage cell wall peptidase
MSPAVEIARGWIGTPYLHQASCRGAGADCLGLVRGVWREMLGQEPVAVPPYTSDWDEVRAGEVLWAAARAHLRPRPGIAAMPGDVLLFRMRDGSVAKHLGILSGGGAAPRFIHAYQGHGVVENSLSAPWRRRLVAAFGFPEGLD